MKKIIILLSLISIIIQVDHCFIEEPVCKTCKVGFYQVDNKYCSKIENCAHVSGDTCEYCAAGYYQNDDRTACLKTNDHCESFYDGKCERCEKGFALNEYTNTCVAFKGCQKVNQDNTKCEDCSDDYYQPNEKGECEIDLCELYNEDKTCQRCFENFYLDEDRNCQLIPFSFCERGDKTSCWDWAGFTDGSDINADKEAYLKKIVSGCDSENSDGTCSRCEKGFTLDEETKKCISNCKEYLNPSSLCDFCEFGYIKVNDDKTCYPINGQNQNDNGNKESKDNNGNKFILFNFASYLVLSLFLLI